MTLTNFLKQHPHFEEDVNDFNFQILFLKIS
ncbi:hypothetical protein SAMN04489735_10684 [Aneurinibacillus thermoaerophilus]|uniref:Uncharacterized protein n=1 Tax=Aneurinibacillus thermoaerophilus TaxID=143495 RepID=A0A1G8FHY5_ANETH|nr:hypothetical protein SAMN04489735_10684 [Aneurinibacillus thermoaerophilus]